MNMKKIIFDNGFRVILNPLPYLRSCSMGIWIGSGSRFETAETSGLSHFIEHMLFKGTDTLSARDIAEITDETGGSLNAYTTKEYTCIYARSLTRHIEKLFSVIGEMITEPLLKESDIELEKGVVTEELLSYEDSSEDLCIDTFYENFWKSDMLGRNIVGKRENILSFDEKMMREHMKKFYVPERMVCVFSGNFNEDDVLKLCEKYFGKLLNTNNPITAGAAQPHRFVKCVGKRFEQNIVTLGFPGIASSDKRLHACNYACAVLGGTGSSRLFQRIREELGLVYSIDAFNTAYLHSGAVCIMMGLSHTNEERAISEVLRLMREFPDTLTKAEFERIKEQTEAAAVMSLESPGTAAARLARGELLSFEAETDDEYLNRLSSVTFEEFSDMAHTLFDTKDISLCVTGKVKTQKFYRELLAL